MNAEPSASQLVKRILRDDPRVGIILAEIIGPPPGLQSAPPRRWDEA